MKIALVHDYLNEAGGAERVLQVLSEMYPQAPIYTAFAKNGTALRTFQGRKIVESRWGWFLKIGRFYSYFRFLLPWVWKSLDLSDYDLVITSCSGYVARGFKVGKKTKVIAYCHTPPKWLYGYETPTDGRNKWWGKLYLTVFGSFIRYFDYMSAQRVDKWMANSREVAKRIRKFYRKEAEVVYPPVEFGESANRRIGKTERGDYYLTVARVVGAKGLVEAARAAGRAKKKLMVVGEVMNEQVRREIVEAGGKYVELKGRVADSELAGLYAGAKGYIAIARDEDFGMTVVEAMSYGTPVLALRSGGYQETVIDPAHRLIGESVYRRISKSVNQLKTGILIEDTSASTVAEGIKRLESTKWDREEIEKWAKTFNRERFEKAVRRIVGA